MGWLRLVGSLKLKVSFAKEPYQRDYILQKRPVIWARSSEVHRAEAAARHQGRSKCDGGGIRGPNSGSLSEIGDKLPKFLSKTQ